MPLSRGVYTPPPMNDRCMVRNPGDKPTATEDAFGNPVIEPEWGDALWCHTMDRNPTEPQAEEDVVVREARTVFTIRARMGIAADAEVVYPVNHDGSMNAESQIYELVAPPVRRGGLGQGILAKFMELHAQRRA